MTRDVVGNIVDTHVHKTLSSECWLNSSNRPQSQYTLVSVIGRILRAPNTRTCMHSSQKTGQYAPDRCHNIICIYIYIYVTHCNRCTRVKHGQSQNHVTKSTVVTSTTAQFQGNRDTEHCPELLSPSPCQKLLAEGHLLSFLPAVPLCLLSEVFFRCSSLTASFILRCSEYLPPSQNDLNTSVLDRLQSDHGMITL